MLIGGVASVVAAAMGARYWAVVIQAIVIGLVDTGILVRVHRRAARCVHRCGASASCGRSRGGSWARGSLRYFSENIDNVLVGRYLGTADLAFYALAYRLLKLPVRLIGQVVNQVSLPAFSRMQDDKKRLQRWFLTSSRTMATGSYGPIILGILVMPELIPLLFGPKWEPAVLPTQLLALVSMRQMVMMLIGPLFQALGKTKEQFYWTIVAVAATVVGIVIGLQWGIVGVAAGVTISMYLLAPLQIAVAARMVGFRGSEYTRALAAGVDRRGRDGRRVDPGSDAVQRHRHTGARRRDAVRTPFPRGLRPHLAIRIQGALRLDARGRPDVGAPQGRTPTPAPDHPRADELTRMPQMRCLWVSGDVPHPPTHGKFVYSAALSEALAGAGVEVVGVGLANDAGGCAPATAVSWNAVAATRRGRLASVASRLPSMTFATTPLRDRVRSLLAGSHWDAVVVDHLETGWVADLVPRRRTRRSSTSRTTTRAACVTRLQRRVTTEWIGVPHCGSMPRRPGASRRRLVRRAALVVAITESDAARFAADAPGASIIVLTPGYQRDAARRARSTRRRRVKRPSSRASTGT